MTRYYKIALSNPSTKDQIHLPVLCVSSAKCKNSNDSEHFECVCACVCVCHSFHTDSIIIASYESCYRWWPHVSSKTGLWDSAKKMKCHLDHFGVMYALNLSSGPLHSPAVLSLPFGPSNQTCLADLAAVTLKCLWETFDAYRLYISIFMTSKLPIVQKVHGISSHHRDQGQKSTAMQNLLQHLLLCICQLWLKISPNGLHMARGIVAA